MAEGAPIRRSHRTVAVVFTVTVAANVVVAVLGGPEWVGYVALAPLVVLMLTGWYLLWATTPRRRERGRSA
jgi:hypothetical protein